MLSFQSIGDELDDGGEVGLRAKKMRFDIRVGRFNSRGGALVEVGDFLGESIEIFLPPGARQYSSNLGRRKGI